MERPPCLLDRICDAYYLPAWCSVADYARIAEDAGLVAGLTGTTLRVLTFSRSHAHFHPTTGAGTGTGIGTTITSQPPRLHSSVRLFVCFEPLVTLFLIDQ